MSSALPDAPDSVWDDEGHARFGTWGGELMSLSYEDWQGIDRVKREKRWLWLGFFSEELAAAIAIVRTGYAANVFVWVFDRKAGKFLEDVTRVLPGPAAVVADIPADSGEIARYRAVLEGFRVQRDGTKWRVFGRIADVRLDVELVEEADPVTAICPVGTGGPRSWVNVTRKQAVARTSGTVRAGTHNLSANGHGFIDFSHGMLARETVWRWGIGSGSLADGRRVGFTLVADFNDSLENVLWIDGTPRAVGPVTFDTSAEAWAVTGDGLELELEREGTRSQNLDLGLVVSEYVQPLGRWTGTIDGQAFEGVGVAEFHRSVW